MTMKKKLFSIICTICMMFMLLPMTVFAESSGTTTNGLNYTISDTGEVKITGYSGTDGDVVIPSEINGKPVTTIGKNAFDGKNEITSVIIPPSVTSIGEYAFRSTNLTSVTIPGSVENIGVSAFAMCSKLSNVTIGNGVKSIGWCAFTICTSLTNIIIPASVTFIDSAAFNGCSSLSGFQVDGSNTKYSSLNGVLFDKNITKLIRCPQGFTETSYSIPGSVTSIGEGAFFTCEKLTNITIPDGVTSIGSDAFAECSNLTSITIPNNVRSIGDYAFAQCSNLTSITIPNNVTSIGSDAFMGCLSLQSIFLPNGLDVQQAIISFTTTQVRYSIDEGQVAITQITLGDGKSSVDIPATICGYPVVGLSDESLLSMIGSHTCAGGQANSQNKAICGICNQEYDIYHVGWTKLTNDVLENKYKVVSAGFYDYVLTSGNYYLDEDILVNIKVKIGDGMKAADVKLDLNGNKLKSDGAGSLLYISSSKSGSTATLTLMDSSSSKTGMVSNSSGYAVNMGLNGTLNANGGIVEGVIYVGPSDIIDNTDPSNVTVFTGSVFNYGTIKGGTFYGTINDFGTIVDSAKVTVTFNSDGGSSVAEQKVLKGQKATAPTAPTKAGYEFEGWYNGETVYDFDQAVTENITLTAH